MCNVRCYHPKEMANELNRGDAAPSWPLRVILGLVVTALVVVGFQLKYSAPSHSATPTTTSTAASVTTTSVPTSGSTTTTSLPTSTTTQPSGNIAPLPTPD